MAIIKCEKCGLDRSDKVVDCIHCGYKDKSKIECPHCHMANNKGSKICSYCNKKIYNRKLLMLIIGGVFVILLFFLLVVPFVLNNVLNIDFGSNLNVFESETDKVTKILINNEFSSVDYNESNIASSIFVFFENGTGYFIYSMDITSKELKKYIDDIDGKTKFYYDVDGSTVTLTYDNKSLSQETYEYDDGCLSRFTSSGNYMKLCK